MATNTELEERVAALEAKLDAFLHGKKAAELVGAPWWELRAGAFANDPDYDAAMEPQPPFPATLSS